jgi:uncharacterized protein
MLKFEFDSGKDAANRRKHGISLERAVDFDWAEARIEPDTRRDYGEPRFIATGLIEGRLHVMVFARRGDATRVIGLRKANRREVKRHEEKEETSAH